MPQMMPMNWMLMSTMFIIFLISIMIFTHFYKIKIKNNYLKFKKMKKNNWMW